MRCKEMSARAYMLLDIVDRSCKYAVQMLRSRTEVVLADRLEGYPNVIAMVEAADRQSLAEAIMPVLGCIDGITEDLRLLVTQVDEISPDLLTLSHSIPRKKRRKKRRYSEKGINAKINSERR
jgi:hypothetical protein